MDVLSSIGWWQVAGLLFGSIYIIAAAKEYQQCWIYGLFSAMCIVVVDFTETLLYIDGILHILYAALAVLGIWLWKQGKSKKKVMKISRISYKGYFGYLLLSVIISVGAGYLLTTQTPVYLYSMLGISSVTSTSGALGTKNGKNIDALN